jgi:hypothetical protein
MPFCCTIPTIPLDRAKSNHTPLADLCLCCHLPAAQSRNVTAVDSLLLFSCLAHAQYNKLSSLAGALLSAVTYLHTANYACLPARPQDNTVLHLHLHGAGVTQPDLQPPTRHERGPPFPEPAGEEAHLFQRPPTRTRFQRKSMHISSLPSCASIMKAFFTYGRIWGPRPCSAPTPVATNDFSEREPLLVGQKRPRRSSSVASMLNIFTVGDSMRLRLSCRRR